MKARAPLSVVIPALNAGKGLAACLAALVNGAVAGLVREVVVVDGGSADDTVAVAEGAGATVVSCAPGRGPQLIAGAAAASGDWLLFLHADTILGETWVDEIAEFIAAHEARVGVFTLRFDEKGFAPSLVAAGAMLRTRALRAPYGDQGLVVSRALYDALGGYRPMPLFEDLNLIDRLVRSEGGRALHVFATHAVTSAIRYRAGGYARRVLKNAACLTMYRLGVAPERILAFYHSI